MGGTELRKYFLSFMSVTVGQMKRKLLFIIITIKKEVLGQAVYMSLYVKACERVLSMNSSFLVPYLLYIG